MRIRHHASLGLAATACLVLSGCTNAADWNANRSSQIHSFDTSSIQAQPDIIAKLPQGALEDGVLDVPPPRTTRRPSSSTPRARPWATTST